ncbi:oxidoreductase [Aureococcus anophagefferens]|nr:oxidoreductase [Aureococcus anophagefferens]
MGFEAFGWANWLAPERYEKTKNSSGDLADFERQNDFSFNNRVYEGDLAEACHHFGVVGMPYGALAEAC